MPLPDRLNYKLITSVYKSLNGLSPNYLTDLYVPASQIQQQATRSLAEDLFHEPMARKEMYKRSFAVLSCVKWNGVPLSIRNAPSITSFKAQYCARYWSNY